MGGRSLRSLYSFSRALTFSRSSLVASSTSMLQSSVGDPGGQLSLLHVEELALSACSSFCSARTWSCRDLSLALRCGFLPCEAWGGSAKPAGALYLRSQTKHLAGTPSRLLLRRTTASGHEPLQPGLLHCTLAFAVVRAGVQLLAWGIPEAEP